MASTDSQPVQWRISPVAFDFEAIAVQALAAAARGAKVLIIRNTIPLCTQTQRALERLSGIGPLDPRLFGIRGIPAMYHSRYSRVDRSRLDHQLQADFGEHAGPGGRIAIGTGRIESRELNVDLLICDLAPMDTMMRRIGMAHRCSSSNSKGLGSAKVQVLSPQERALSAYEPLQGEVGSQIYRDPRAFAAARQLVESHPTFGFPQDCRWLIEQGVHVEALAAIGPIDHPCWPTTIVERTADARGSDFANGDSPYLRDLKAPARISEHTRRAIFSPAPMGPFGRAVLALDVPEHWVEAEPENPTPTEVELGEGAVRFTFAGRRFMYDRFGLRPKRGDADS